MSLLNTVLPNYTDFKSVVVPCVCMTGHPFPPSPDCEHCNGTGKISYGIAEVEVT